MALDKLTKVQSVGISSFIQVVGVVTATGGFVGDVTGTTSNASGATGDFSIADKIVHTGDTNTALRFPAADTITAETGGSERLRITSGGSVGIGTDNPQANLHIFEGTGSTQAPAASGNNLVIDSNSEVGMSLLFGTDSNTAYGNIYWGNSTDGSADGRITYFGSTYTTAADRQAMVFRTANTERLRITSAGIVKIPDNGKFIAGAGDDLQIYHDGSHSYVLDNGTGDLRLASNGVTAITKGDSEMCAGFNVDGAVDLYYDNSKKFETVSNGTKTTGRVYLNGTNGGLDYNNIAHTLEYIVNGSTHSELNTGAYVPAGSKNLGANAHRWGTLYLSNGIDFGSTSDASGMTSEVLDDYEEGTWTPQLLGGSSNPSLTYSAQSGGYEKIGNLVHLAFFMNVSAVNSQGSGYLELHGLPYTPVTSPLGASEVPALVLQTQPFTDGKGANKFAFVRTVGGSSRMFVGYRDLTNGNAIVPTQGAGNISTGYFIGHITYRAS